MIPNKYLASICLFFSFSYLTAQEKLPIKFGKVSLNDFDLKSTLIDSNTNAVVIADVGKTEFLANASELTFSLNFVQKRRVKIINKKGFDVATITIPLYISGGKVEKLEGLKASTYNIENGKVVETSVERSDIFTEKHNKNWEYRKFTFPALKEGSIIEYSYQIKSDFFFNLQSWKFQGQYPVLWSQYEANIPEFFKYVTLAQGYLPFFINKNETSQVQFSFIQRSKIDADRIKERQAAEQFDVTGSIDYHTWVMKDVPALKWEAFTTTIENSISKIEFQLNQVKFPNSLPVNYMDNWQQVSTGLLESENFGVPIERANNWLDDKVEFVVKTAATQSEKAQKIYEFVRDNFSCTDQNKLYTGIGLKEVFKNKSGSVAEINLLLIAMLRAIKMEADPVILSTRSNGRTHEIYPLMGRFNYVIAQLKIGDATIYLDASVASLAFGKLPTEVYNGHARVIYKNLATPVYFMADSLKEATKTLVFISNMDKGGVEGNFTNVLGFYESLELRDKLKKTGRPDYEKSLRESFSDETVIKNVEIDSLKLLGEPVAVKYNLQFKTFDEADIVYFNPMLNQAIKKNPFVSADRFYPVEMPYTMDDLYTFNMEVPKGYKVDELPKSVRFNLNESEGMFEYIIVNSGDKIQLRCRLVIGKATFLNEDYESLREFFAFVVKKEAEQIVFKKIK